MREINEELAFDYAILLQLLIRIRIWVWIHNLQWSPRGCFRLAVGRAPRLWCRWSLRNGRIFSLLELRYICYPPCMPPAIVQYYIILGMLVQNALPGL